MNIPTLSSIFKALTPGANVTDRFSVGITIDLDRPAKLGLCRLGEVGAALSLGESGAFWIGEGASGVAGDSGACAVSSIAGTIGTGGRKEGDRELKAKSSRVDRLVRFIIDCLIFEKKPGFAVSG